MRAAIYATGGAAVLLAGLATYQGIAAHGSYQEARGLLRPDGSFASGSDQGRYNAVMERGDSAAERAYLAAGGALLMAAATGVLWLVTREPSSAAAVIRF